MKIKIEDVLIIETKVFGDHQRYFIEIYNKLNFQEVVLDIETANMTELQKLPQLEKSLTKCLIEIKIIINGGKKIE